jgi:hypothetical protein
MAKAEKLKNRLKLLRIILCAVNHAADSARRFTEGLSVYVMLCI